MEENDKIRDTLGSVFYIGDVITYPGRRSSTLFVRHAVVLERDDEKKRLKVRTYRKSWRGQIDVWEIWLHRYDRCTIVRDYSEAMLQDAMKDHVEWSW